MLPPLSLSTLLETQLGQAVPGEVGVLAPDLDQPMPHRDGTRQARRCGVHTIALMIVRRVLGVVGYGRSPDADAVEIAVLRHRS
jgi:hypothetical protein